MQMQACAQAGSDDGSDDDDGKMTPKKIVDGTDAAADTVLLEVQAKRDAIVGSSSASFRCTVRGGDDTMARFGIAFDYFKGEAKPGLPCQFCGLAGIPKSANYSLSLYGEQISVTLMQAWVSKMQFIFDLWQAAGSPSPVGFTADELARWNEPLELAKLSTVLPIDVAVIGRIHQIRQLPN
jgi:hypothetical protein